MTAGGIRTVADLERRAGPSQRGGCGLPSPPGRRHPHPRRWRKNGPVVGAPLPERGGRAGKPRRILAVSRIPMIIGGKDVHADETFEAVMPHRKTHVLADVAKGGPEHVEQAIAAANAAHHEWSRMPWHERAAVFLRAAELLAGPWRSTLNAATILNQSKTSHQAEIDAVCEMVDFWRYNVDYILRIYSEQPHSPTGIWNRLEYRPLEGFVFAVSPFNFSCIGGEPVRRRRRSWAARSCGSRRPPRRSPPTTTCVCSRRPGCPTASSTSCTASGSTIGERRPRAARDLAGIHFTGSTGVFNGMWETVGKNIARRYRGYPRLVGETGGKDFILAHPSADAEASQPRSCVAPSSTRGRSAPRPRASTSRRTLARGAGEARRGRRVDPHGRPCRLRELHGRRDRRERVQDPADAIAEAQSRRRRDRHRRHARTTPRATSSSRP